MRKALIVGLNNYSHSPLSGCINDAEAIANLLESHEDGSPDFSLKLKTNLETKNELYDLVKKLFDGPNDIALFYYSGHGNVSEWGGYIVTPDCENTGKGISMHDIMALANASEARDKIIILDCCFSGEMGNDIFGTGVTNIAEGVTILTASRANESSIEYDGHGVFTSLLIGALDGGATDLTGHITPSSIYSYIDQALGAWDQRPVFKTNVFRFTSLRRVNPPISQEDLRMLTKLFIDSTDTFALNPSFEFTAPAPNSDNVKTFKLLQRLEGVGLVKPVGENHMYFAAMNSKSCKLTLLGIHYWNLVMKGRV